MLKANKDTFRPVMPTDIHAVSSHDCKANPKKLITTKITAGFMK